MSSKPKKNSNMGKRYSDAKKQEVVAFANKINADKGRGGQSAAARKFGISILTVSAWLKSAVTAPKAKPVAVKAVGKAAGKALAVKAVGKAGKKAVPQGKRYPDDRKKEILDYLAAVNARKGRGGLSAASKKFRVSPITITNWLNKFGLKAPKPASSVKTKTLLALGNQVAKAEKALVKLKAMLEAIK